MVVRGRYALWVPWVFPVNEGNVTKLSGVARDVYDSMEKTYNMEFEIKLQEDLTFGAITPNGSFTGVLGAMQRNETDVAGPFFITEQRAQVVDFTLPLAFSQLAIISGLVPGNRDPFLILRIFSVKVWLLIVLATVFASGGAALIYMIFPSKTKKTKTEVIFKYIWLFYGALLGKDFGSENRWYLHSVLVTAGFRILISIWLIGPALIFMNTYQGAITSAFVADKLKPLIGSLEELHQNKKVNPSTFANAYAASCFKKLKGTKFDLLSDRVGQNYKSPTDKTTPEWLEDVANGKLAFTSEIGLMKSMIGNRFKKTGKCGIIATPIDLCSAYLAFGFRRKFNLTIQQKFNSRLLQFTEGQLYHRHVLASLAAYDTCARASPRTTKPLELSDLFGAFLLHCAGVSVSLLVFLVEKATKCRKSSRKAIVTVRIR